MQNRADNTSELIDLYDTEGNPTGKTQARGSRIPDGLKKLIILVLVENQDGLMVMQQRSLNKIGRPGEWGAFVSGSVHSKELSKDAAKREVQEELGLDITPIFYQRTMTKGKIIDYYYGQGKFNQDDIMIQKTELEQAQLVDINQAIKFLDSNRLSVDYKEYLVLMHQELNKEK